MHRFECHIAFCYFVEFEFRALNPETDGTRIYKMYKKSLFFLYELYKICSENVVYETVSKL